MKIINTGLMYFPQNSEGSAYRGKIKLTKAEFRRAINKIMLDKEVSDGINGSGKYPYLSKNLLREDLEKRKVERKGCTDYALRVGFADYIQKMFKNTSRYHYKRQNYIIQVNK